MDALVLASGGPASTEQPCARCGAVGSHHTEWAAGNFPRGAKLQVALSTDVDALTNHGNGEGRRVEPVGSRP